MKYPFIVRHRAVWSVSELCRTLGVSRSGFYEWHGRSPSAREQANERLAGRIRENYQASDRTYGNPRVWRDLRAQPEMGGRLYLRLDCAGLALRGGRHGLVFTAYRRLVHAGQHDVAVSDRRPDDGVESARPATRSPASLRPGQPVHQPAVPDAAGRRRDRVQHEPARGLLG